MLCTRLQRGRKNLKSILLFVYSPGCAHLLSLQSLYLLAQATLSYVSSHSRDNLCTIQAVHLAWHRFRAVKILCDVPNTMTSVQFTQTYKNSNTSQSEYSVKHHQGIWYHIIALCHHRSWPFHLQKTNQKHFVMR